MTQAATKSRYLFAWLTIQLQHECISCDLNRMLPFIVDFIPATIPTQNRIGKEDPSAVSTICTRWSSALLAAIPCCTRATAATAGFWGREKLWTESIAAARHTTTATHLLIAFFTPSTLYLIFGSAIEGNHFAVGIHTFCQLQWQSNTFICSDRQWRVGRTRQLCITALPVRFGAVQVPASLLLPQEATSVRVFTVPSAAEPRHGVLTEIRTDTCLLLLIVTPKRLPPTVKR